jgi:hypothetical protein
VDGFHQRELNVVNPSFPVAAEAGVVPAVNRYVLGSDYQLPRTTRVSAGVDQTIFKTARVSATYSYQRGANLARGLNLNPPVDGVRPNVAFANIIEVVSDAASRRHQLQVDGNINPGALLPAFNGPRVSWKRTTVFITETLGSFRNNTDGAFGIPATGDLAAEWGPGAGGAPAGGLPVDGFAFGGPQTGSDVRNRLNVTFNNQIVRNVLISLGVNTTTAPPYTMFSGRDDNGDGIFNDRPAGVGRNTLRGSGQTSINLTAGYVFAFGQTAALPPGIGVFGSGGAVQVRSVDQGTSRYRLQLFLQMQNLTNHRNYLGYSGTVTSPFFGMPTAVSDMRKVSVGASLSF